MTGRESRLWGLEDGCGIAIVKWRRTRKKNLKVFDGIRLFDNEPFVMVSHSSVCNFILSLQKINNVVVILGRPMRKKRYKEHPNIEVMQVIPVGLSYQLK